MLPKSIFITNFHLYYKNHKQESTLWQYYHQNNTYSIILLGITEKFDGVNLDNIYCYTGCNVANIIYCCYTLWN